LKTLQNRYMTAALQSNEKGSGAPPMVIHSKLISISDFSFPISYIFNAEKITTQ
jgi:hypothetical protein